jgi:hypothetical protein
MMKKTVLIAGFCGILLLVSAASADPVVVSTEKTYRLLQTVTAQLEEAQNALAASGSPQASAALVAAQEQVRTASAHCCQTLYAAQLKAAKAALAQHDRQQAVHYLLKADETLERCADLSPGAAPQKEQETPAFKSALAQR